MGNWFNSAFRDSSDVAMRWSPLCSKARVAEWDVVAEFVRIRATIRASFPKSGNFGYQWAIVAIHRWVGDSEPFPTQIFHKRRAA
jgi:hypothetical protein